jgi:hypothetical protein
VKLNFIVLRSISACHKVICLLIRIGNVWRKIATSHVIQPILKSVSVILVVFRQFASALLGRVFSTIVINFLLTGSALIVFRKVKQYIVNKRRQVLKFDSAYCEQDYAEV